MYKFTHEIKDMRGETCSRIDVTVPYDDVTAPELKEHFRSFMAACGFTECTIEEVLGESP